MFGNPFIPKRPPKYVLWDVDPESSLKAHAYRAIAKNWRKHGAHYVSLCGMAKRDRELRDRLTFEVPRRVCRLCYMQSGGARMLGVGV